MLPPKIFSRLRRNPHRSSSLRCSRPLQAFPSSTFTVNGKIRVFSTAEKRSFHQKQKFDEVGGLEGLILRGLPANTFDGTITELSTPLVKVAGLKDAKIGSIVRFEDGSLGVTLRLSESFNLVGRLTADNSFYTYQRGPKRTEEEGPIRTSEKHLKNTHEHTSSNAHESSPPHPHKESPANTHNQSPLHAHPTSNSESLESSPNPHTQPLTVGSRCTLATLSDESTTPIAKSFKHSSFRPHTATNTCCTVSSYLESCFLSPSSFSSVFHLPPRIPISERTTFNKRLPTGIASLELLAPLGQGQSICFSGPQADHSKSSSLFPIITSFLNEKAGHRSERCSVVYASFAGDNSIARALNKWFSSVEDELKGHWKQRIGGLEGEEGAQECEGEGLSVKSGALKGEKVVNQCEAASAHSLRTNTSKAEDVETTPKTCTQKFEYTKQEEGFSTTSSKPTSSSHVFPKTPSSPRNNSPKFTAFNVSEADTSVSRYLLPLMALHAALSDVSAGYSTLLILDDVADHFIASEELSLSFFSDLLSSSTQTGGGGALPLSWSSMLSAVCSYAGASVTGSPLTILNFFSDDKPFESLGSFNVGRGGGGKFSLFSSGYEGIGGVSGLSHNSAVDSESSSNSSPPFSGAKNLSSGGGKPRTHPKNLLESLSDVNLSFDSTPSFYASSAGAAHLSYRMRDRSASLSHSCSQGGVEGRKNFSPLSKHAEGRVVVPPHKAFSRPFNVDAVNFPYWLNSYFQHPLLKATGESLMKKFQLCQTSLKEVYSKEEMSIYVDYWERDALASSRAAMACVFTQAPGRVFSLAETVLIGRAALVYYFFTQKPSFDVLVDFQEKLLAEFSVRKPGLWEALNEALGLRDVREDKDESLCVRDSDSVRDRLEQELSYKELQGKKYAVEVCVEGSTQSYRDDLSLLGLIDEALLSLRDDLEPTRFNVKHFME